MDKPVYALDGSTWSILAQNDHNWEVWPIVGVLFSLCYASEIESNRSNIRKPGGDWLINLI